MKLVEQHQYVVGLVPYDMAGGAGTGDYVSLKNHSHLTIHFIKDAGSAGEDVTLTLYQATAVGGTSAKAATIITDVYYKRGATALNAVGTFTKTTQTAASTYTDAALGENEAHIVIEIDADELDVDSGFDCVRLDVTDSGSGTGAYGVVLYELSGTRYQQEAIPSAIAD